MALPVAGLTQPHCWLIRCCDPAFRQRSQGGATLVQSQLGAPAPCMDYAAEQEMELEALAAIFADDFRGGAAATHRACRGPARRSLTLGAARRGRREPARGLARQGVQHRRDARHRGPDGAWRRLCPCAAPRPRLAEAHCAAAQGHARRAVRLELLFAYPHTYPDEPPLYRARRRGAGAPARAARSPRLGSALTTRCSAACGG